MQGRIWTSGKRVGMTVPSSKRFAVRSVRSATPTFFLLTLAVFEVILI